MSDCEYLSLMSMRSYIYVRLELHSVINKRVYRDLWSSLTVKL